MEVPEEVKHDHKEEGEEKEGATPVSPREEEQQDYGNLQFGEYILNLNGVDSRFILFRDFVDDEVKGTQYLKQGEDAVLVMHHAKFKRKGDSISWQREGVDALALSGMISPEGHLGGGVYKTLSFITASKKKSHPWTTSFERKLI